MAKKLDEKILIGFSRELQTYVLGIREGLECFRNDTTQGEVLDQTLQHVHTMKGALEMMGFSGLSQVTTYIEEALEAALAGTAPLDVALDAWLAHTVGQLETNLEGLLSGDVPEEAFVTEVERIRSHSQGFAETANTASAPEVSEVPASSHLSTHQADEQIAQLWADDELPVAEAGLVELTEPNITANTRTSEPLSIPFDEAMSDEEFREMGVSSQLYSSNLLQPWTPEIAPGELADEATTGQLTSSEADDVFVTEMLCDLLDDVTPDHGSDEEVEAVPGAPAADLLMSAAAAECVSFPLEVTADESLILPPSEVELSSELFEDSVYETEGAEVTRCEDAAGPSVLDTSHEPHMPEPETSTEPETGSVDELDSLIVTIDSAVQEVYGQGALSSDRRRSTGSDTTSERYLIFSLHGSRYAIAVPYVLEIGRLPSITPIPNVPAWLRGVINLRGEIISVVDLRSFLGIEQASQVHQSRILVVKTLGDEITTSLIVDQVRGFARLPRASIHTTAISIQDKIDPYLMGICEHDEQVFAVFDLERFLLSPEICQFDYS